MATENIQNMTLPVDSSIGEAAKPVEMDMLLTAEILAAQQEADAVVDKEDGLVEEGVMDSILLAPKLLQLPQSEVQEKIQDMKERGKQLDLLLLKAESYSQYVANNQKMTQLRWREEEQNVPTMEKVPKARSVVLLGRVNPLCRLRLRKSQPRAAAEVVACSKRWFEKIQTHLALCCLLSRTIWLEVHYFHTSLRECSGCSIFTKTV